MSYTMDDVKGALEDIAAKNSKFMNAQKERLSETDSKQIELQARLQEIEQFHARSRNGGGALAGAPDSGRYGASLDKLAADIMAGMVDSTSMRLALPMSIKAVSSGAITTTTYSPPAENLGPLSTYHAPVARLVDLLPSRPVTGNSLTYMRVTYDASNSPPDGNKAAVVAELATKPDSTVATTPVTVTMKTFAHWIDAAKQVLDDVVELREILDSILRGGLLDKVDDHIYATLKTSGNFTTFTPAGSETRGDAVARIAAQIANLGGSGIIVALNPLDYLAMQLTKAADSGIYLGMPPNLLASRVVSVAAVAQTKILAFAQGSGASWADREGVNVTAGLKNDDFIKNAVTLLCESRGEALVRDPAHVAYGNITA